MRYVSHEIRTPLNVVLMGLNLMQENALAAASVDGFSELQRQETDATLDLIADMKGSTTMAVDILNDLLTYEKVDSNLLTIEKQDMNMYEVIKSVLLMFKAQARGVGVAFSWDLENSRGVMCEVDGAKIVQVLRNLMSNAIKFTPSGGRVLVAAQIVPVGSSFELPETMSECLLAPSAASARTTSVLTSPRGELHDFNKNHTSLTRKTSQSSKHRSPYILEEVGSEELNEGSDENVAPVTVQSSSTVLVDHQGAISTATVEGRDDWPQAEEAKPKPSPNASSTFSGFVGRLIARCTRSNPNSPKSAPLPAVDPVPVVGQVSESTTPVNPAVPEKEPVGQVVVAAPVLTSVVNTQQTFAPNPVIYSLSSKGDVRSSSLDSAGGSLSSKNFASTKERVLAFPKSDSGDDFEAIKFDRMLRISVTDTGQGVAPVNR